MNRHHGGSGAPLVAIHGIGSSWRAFSPLLPALEAHHEVLAVDLPGFGDSPPLPAGVRPTVYALADAVEATWDEAGFDTPHVVGNSLGGWVALELARRGRARTVVALSPAGFETPRERAFTVRSLETTYALAKLLAPWAETITATPVGRTLVFAQVVARPWGMGAEESAARLRALASSPSFTETLDCTVRGDSVLGLDQIRCPVTIAWGTRDALLLPRQGPRFVRAIPGAELRPLPRLGHVPMFDDPALVAETVLARTG